MNIKKTLALVSLFLINISFSQNKLPDEITTIINSKTFSNSQTSVYAEFVDNNEVVIDYNGDYSLAPASGLKVFTTSVAINVLGPKSTFKTGIYYSGEIKNGILKGNIYVKGGGDPTLGSTLVKGSLSLDSLMSFIKSEIIKAGIKEIKGSIIADNTLFKGNSTPDYYPYIDMGNYYGAGVDALTLHDNLYYLHFKPGKPGEIATVKNTIPEVPGLKFINYMKTGEKNSGDNGYIYGGPGEFNLTLRGTVPADGDDFAIKGSIPDAALFTVQTISNYLNKNKIKVTGLSSKVDYTPDYSKMKLIVEIHSPKLEDIVYIVNKKSFNLYAETLLRHVGIKLKGEGSVEAGTAAIKDYLDSVGINVSGLHMMDGSGLSRTNCITAKIMTKLLKYEYSQSGFGSFFNSLGVTGDPNDISYYARFGKGTSLAYNGYIKSGLISGVSSHSGYIKTKSGRYVCFSIITNNYHTSLTEIEDRHIEIMEYLAELK